MWTYHTSVDEASNASAPRRKEPSLYTDFFRKNPEPPEERTWLSTLVSQATRTSTNESLRTDTNTVSRTTTSPSSESDVPTLLGVEQPLEKLQAPPDVTTVTWRSENDQANPQNWSLVKKVFVSGLINLLTFFDVCRSYPSPAWGKQVILKAYNYIGSAIYTP